MRKLREESDKVLNEAKWTVRLVTLVTSAAFFAVVLLCGFSWEQAIVLSVGLALVQSVSFISAMHALLVLLGVIAEDVGTEGHRSYCAVILRELLRVAKP